MMSPEQQRQKSRAQEESLRHAQYAAADGSMRTIRNEPLNSNAIHAELQRVNAATAKEDASIAGKRD
jgi:hypothetical protein